MISTPLPPLTLLLLLLRSSASASVPTFPAADPHSGRPLQCESCPPGSHLRARCTEASRTVCAPCPPGSFTEVWNYIGTCLRCGVCSINEEARAPCTARSDCQCQCKAGYFRRNGMCALHSECPTGKGVRVPGTPSEDTMCQPCSNNTFSDTVSANQRCMPHRSCQGADLQLLLNGTVWHDNICTNCQGIASREGADIIKEILPAFFLHHGISERKLRRILQRLRASTTTSTDYSNPQAEFLKWLNSATLEQITRLPVRLKSGGARGIGERLHNKLQKVKSRLRHLCNVG